MVYLSPGSLPSKWAHSGQIAKMSEAFAQQVPDFEMVTAGDLLTSFSGMDEHFLNWYGLHQQFKLVRLPVFLKCDALLPKDFESDRFFKLSALYACFKALFSTSPFLIYTRTIGTANLLQEIGIPFMLEWHDFFDDQLHVDLQDRNLLGVVTTLPNLAESYVNQGLDAKKVLVIPNASDLKTFLPHQSKAECRSQLAIDPTEKVVLYSGHLYDYKGIPMLLEVARMMPDFRFIFVGGWAEDVEKVRAECQRLELENVVLVGHVPQAKLATYLYAADVLILPTSLKIENLANISCPLKLFDYMAVKKPIVASKLPTIQTILKHKQNALLAEPDNPFDFKDCIFNLFNYPSLAESIANQAYQDVQNYTWDRRAAAVLKFAVEKLANDDGKIDNDKIQSGRIKAVKKFFRCLNTILR